MTQLLSPEQLARKLSVATQTIYNRVCHNGDLPPVLKIGRLPRFRAADVELWLAGKLPPARPPAPAPAAPRRRGRPTKAEQIAARAAGGAR